MKAYLQLIRARHYIKNLLVFTALFFSGQFFDSHSFISCGLGFIAFCTISSVVYIINDLQDREKDRKHPTKCRRPLAAGTIDVKNAIFLAVLLFVASIICNLSASGDLSVIGLLGLYFALNLAYSFGLKNKPIVDVAILVSGFLIRILYGALLVNLVISNWLYLTALAGASYFALGKRRNELLQIGATQETRKVLKAYSYNFLDKCAYMFLTLTHIFYALWCMDKSASSSNNEGLICTVPLALLITMKYCLNIEGNSDGDPVEVLARDKTLIALSGLYLAIMMVILYL